MRETNLPSVPVAGGVAGDAGHDGSENCQCGCRDEYLDGPWVCPECDEFGMVISCPDDMCRGAGECFHGDGYRPCWNCDGNGNPRAPQQAAVPFPAEAPKARLITIMFRGHDGHGPYRGLKVPALWVPVERIEMLAQIAKGE